MATSCLSSTIHEFLSDPLNGENIASSPESRAAFVQATRRVCSPPAKTRYLVEGMEPVGSLSND